MIRIWINDIELDLSEDFFFPITYSQADAKEPEKRKRDSSKTIVMPGTSINNSFFSSAYDLNISDVYGDLVGFDFDPTLRYPCRVTRHGKPIFRGSSHLQKVVTKMDVTNGRINEFKVVLYSELANIFQALGDIKVSELGWAEYEHTLSVANIVASWTATTGSGYWYPLIDYGFTPDQLSYLTNQLRPYVYVKEIVEKCLEKTGYTLSSTFFNSTLIKKMVWGYGGGEPILLDSSEVAARRAHYTGDGNSSYNFPLTLITLTNTTTFYHNVFIPISDNTVVTMTQVADPTAQFDEPTGEIVVANAGYYNLAIAGTFPVTYTYSDVGLPNQQIVISVKIRTFVNGALVNEEVSLIAASSAGSDNLVYDINQALECNTGDIVKSDIHISTNGSSVGGNAIGETLDITFDLDNTLDMDFTAVNIGLIDGDTVKVSRFLPEMKAADFLLDMITMFNLYITDPDQDGNIIMLPEDDYFFDTNDTDLWNDKLQRAEDIEIEPAANIEGKTYRFRFAEDRDYYKQLYFNQEGVDYGDYDYNVPSTFKKSEKIYQLKIAQSVPVQIEGTNIIVPRIIQLDESTQVAKPHKGKPRIFFNNGLIASDSWSLVNSDTLVASVQTSYPQAHHLDNLTTAAFDLNFGRPEIVYYIATTYTDDNLFYRYNAQFIRQLTGRDSKLVNAWFRLRETDFYENFMRRLCNIDGVVYRKNVVKDWIANTNMLVKVELLKIVEGNSRRNYLQTLPPAVLPPMSYGGEPDAPITDDTTAKSSQVFYQFDTSAKDLTVTLDADSLRPGWRGSIKKVSTPGKLTIATTGGGATGTDIDGDVSVDLTHKNDSIDVYFNGQFFKIV